MNNRKTLWFGISLPKWDGRKTYELYLKHAFGKPRKRDRDDYSRQLMILITANFTRAGWITALRKEGLDPEEIAADVLTHLYLKSQNLRLDSPCQKVLLTVLNRSIYNRVMSLIRKGRSRDREISESQAFDPDDEGLLAHHSRTQDVDTQRLERILRSDEATGYVCDRVHNSAVLHGKRGSRRGGVYPILVTYRYLVRQLVRRNTILTHSELPERLRERIDANVQHAEIAYRLNRLVRELAGGGECIGWGDNECDDSLPAAD